MSQFGGSVAPTAPSASPVVNGRIIVKQILTGYGEIVDKKLPIGTTVRAFTAAQPAANTDALHVTVNGKPSTPDYVLQHGDEVSFSPKSPKNAS